ncbi:hypothetical protein GQ44DRAFT_731559 [Phaeosphaeriaceae sp. PMI808]|nr:hypothetical protein GQ44DRAFT_731559 [Phaeosphaeriaceae sp. PMI808]
MGTFIYISSEKNAVDCHHAYAHSIPDHDMDAKSNLILPHNNEIFSIDSLIKNVEEFQRREQFETLKRLRLENKSLHKQIMRYQTHRCLAPDLIQTAYDALMSLQGALNKCLREEAAVDRDWLVQLGIRNDSVDNVITGHTGWI